MQIRKYAVHNMKEAIAKVKGDLGSDAVILASRTMTKRGKSYLEVTAAIDYEAEIVGQRESAAKQAPVYRQDGSAAANPQPEIDSTVESGITRILQAMHSFDGRLAGIERGGFADHLTRKVDRLNESLSDVVRLLGTNLASEAGPVFFGEQQRMYERLLASGVIPQTAAELVEAVLAELSEKNLSPEGNGVDFLAAKLIGRVPLKKISHEGRRICALVGPTGTGKTTTIAKLAAQERFGHGRKVGFVTVDTYRIGAIDQLRTYAGILKAQVEVAMDGEDLRRKVEFLSEADTIFIDTAGISPRDEKMMAGLADCLTSGPKIESHLVLSASTRLEDMNDTADQFGVMPIDSIIVSKIDEVGRLGNIFNFICQQRPPLSYFTTGQSVPEDLEEASGERIADMVLGISTAA